MKTGITDSAYLLRYGYPEGLRRMKAHGYDCLDYQRFADTTGPLFALNDAEFARTLGEQRRQIEDAGIEITQTHGPWRYPPQDATPEDRAERFEKMSRSILGTALLGCKHFVIHPIMPFGPDKDPEPQRFWDMNIEFMTRLTDVARQHQVIICFENMPMLAHSIATPEAILRFAKTIDSPWFKVCLDTGHCAVFGLSPADAVRLLGKDYLRVMHVHDNNGRNDFHWLPYNGVVDWQAFSDALAEIGYEGAVSLECEIPRKFPNDIVEPAEKALATVAAKIARQI